MLRMLRELTNVYLLPFLIRKNYENNFYKKNLNINSDNFIIYNF